MDLKLKLLEDILKRNSDDPNSVDITDEVDHYFYFDAIKSNDDLEAAWSVFEEQDEIRKRLSLIESNTETIPGWGYRIPKTGQATCTDEELKSVVSSHIHNLRPFLLEEAYNKDIIEFIDNDFTVEIAPQTEEIPDTSKNKLFGVLYEAIEEYWIEHFPYDKPHYKILKNWAIYLTKCDEVAAYLIWPCLNHKKSVDPLVLEPGAKLWKLDCRDRYWVKDLNYNTKVVYVSPACET